MAEQKVMSRVMKLLELSNDPNTSEHERQLAADHAERLMAQHMIDRMDLKAENPTKVVTDTWTVRIGEAGGEFSYHIIELMGQVIRHCGARMHPRSVYAEREDGNGKDYSTKVYTVIGFPEDMAYAEQVWFRVFRGFISNVNPSWDSSKPLAENVYHFVNAGFSWGEIHGKATGAGNPLPELLKGGGAKLRSLHKEECARRNEPYGKTRTRDAYRATFVQSYGATIGRRLLAQRKQATESVSSADKYALAVRTTKERVDEEFYRLWPEYDPAVIKRMRDAEYQQRVDDFNSLSSEDQKALIQYAEDCAEETRKANEEYDRKWEARQRAAEKRRRNYGAVRERVTFDQAAWDRGHASASKVNLNNDAEVKDGKKGELK